MAISNTTDHYPAAWALMIFKFVLLLLVLGDRSYFGRGFAAPGVRVPPAALCKGALYRRKLQLTE
ncbi:hypothetical protein [Nostoc sp. FACHB-133]|uniref:hypothetical protein n=1 Tax=Nostoc sp. FACHB-133 TaxID=2692835 RepID=UPI0016839D80|nr:hypothetical protein [Nostoc sp. FACHB-133]MBD2526792.1 hypothetical protein [Nostoc sp. FACHB-133]